MDMTHENVSALNRKYPRYAGELFQIYQDLLYAQKWRSLSAVDLISVERPVLVGYRPDDDGKDPVMVVPCQCSDVLSPQLIQSLFFALEDQVSNTVHNGEEGGPSQPRWRRDFIYLAITAPDSSQVYYKISNGISKPSL
ncbi:hypothetical protein FRC14_005302 [Serendipita sp. 396]|nr:hypothetical protein FRC14_005302 [Serendipita sp. 396]KAG8867903.1 hypothetical protein FRC20_004569 [Serendipita sp. 405]